MPLRINFPVDTPVVMQKFIILLPAVIRKGNGIIGILISVGQHRAIILLVIGFDPDPNADCGQVVVYSVDLGIVGDARFGEE